MGRISDFLIEQKEKENIRLDAEYQRRERIRKIRQLAKKYEK